MAYEIELIFQDQKLHKLLRGRFKVQHGRLTVTAEDGTTKTLPLDGNDADAMARSVLPRYRAWESSLDLLRVETFRKNNASPTLRRIMSSHRQTSAPGGRGAPSCLLE
jgi:hypothetical protein